MRFLGQSDMTMDGSRAALDKLLRSALFQFATSSLQVVGQWAADQVAALVERRLCRTTHIDHPAVLDCHAAMASWYSPDLGLDPKPAPDAAAANADCIGKQERAPYQDLQLLLCFGWLRTLGAGSLLCGWMTAGVAQSVVGPPAPKPTRGKKTAAASAKSQVAALFSAGWKWARLGVLSWNAWGRLSRFSWPTLGAASNRAPPTLGDGGLAARACGRMPSASNVSERQCGAHALSVWWHMCGCVLCALPSFVAGWWPGPLAHHALPHRMTSACSCHGSRPDASPRFLRNRPTERALTGG